MKKTNLFVKSTAILMSAMMLLTSSPLTTFADETLASASSDVQTEAVNEVGSTEQSRTDTTATDTTAADTTGVVAASSENAAADTTAEAAAPVPSVTDATAGQTTTAEAATVEGTTAAAATNKWTATAADGAVITAEAAENVLSGNLTMEATPEEVTPAITDAITKDAVDNQFSIQKVAVYDITFKDAAGSEVEPNNANGDVSITISNPEITANSAEVYHAKDTEEVEKVNDVQTTGENEVAFAADSFSSYVIVNKGSSTISLTMQYYIAGTNTVLQNASTQQIAVGTHKLDDLASVDSYTIAKATSIVDDIENELDSSDITVATDATIRVYYTSNTASGDFTDLFYAKKSLGGQVAGSDDSWWINFELGGTSSVSKPTDVVFIIDESGSMAYSSRMTNLKNSLLGDDNDGLLASILPSGTNNRVSIVGFSTDVDNYDRYGFSGDYTTVAKEVSALSPDSSTYISNGIDDAYDVMSGTADKNAIRADANQVVIVLTDGVPGQYSSTDNNGTSYAEALIAKTSMKKLKDAYPNATVYTVSYGTSDLPGTTQITSNYVDTTKNIDTTFGAAVTKYYGRNLYYANDIPFSKAFLQTIASNASCYSAADSDTISTVLTKVLNASLHKTASDIVLTDDVSDVNFKYTTSNGTPVVQYSTDGTTWSDLGTDTTADNYYLVKTVSGSDEGGSLEFHLSYAANSKVYVRFQETLNDGVYSAESATASAPDLLTNDRAEVSYKDANGVSRIYTSTNPEAYANSTDLDSPAVYRKDTRPNIGDIVKNKTVTLTDWNERTYQIDLTASSTKSITNTTTADIVLVLDTSGSMTWDSSYQFYKNEYFSNLDTSGNYYLQKDGTWYGLKYGTYSYGQGTYTGWLYESYAGYSNTTAGNNKNCWYPAERPDNNGNYVFNPNNSYDIYKAKDDEKSRLATVQAAAIAFIQSIKAKSPDSKIAVVDYDSQYNASSSTGLLNVTSGQTDLTTAINDMVAGGGTAPGAGLDQAYSLLTAAGAASDGAYKYVVLLSDGKPDSDKKAATDTAAAEIKNSTAPKITLETIGVSLDTTAKVYMSSWASTVNEQTLSYETTTTDGIMSAFSTIGDSITDLTISGASIVDYIDSRFEITNKSDIEASGGTISQDATTGQYYVTWTPAAIGHAKDGVAGWTGTITVKAKDGYIGGNNVTTNGASSGITLNGQTTNFDQPTVNVKVKFTIGDGAETIFWGDTASFNSSTEQSALLNLSGQSYSGTSGYTIGNGTSALSASDFTFNWYTNPECTKNATAFNSTPEQDVAYYLTASYNAGSATDTSNSNSTIDGKVYKNDANVLAENSTDSAKKYGTYTIHVVKGELDLTKLIDKQYTGVNVKNAEETFVFKIERFDKKTDSSAADTYYMTVSFDANGTITKGTGRMTGLKKGYYTVTEETSWTPKYDLMTKSDNYDGNKSAAECEKLFIGEKTSASDAALPTFYGLEQQTYAVYANGSPATVTFKNQKRDVNWLSDVAAAINKFVS